MASIKLGAQLYTLRDYIKTYEDCEATFKYLNSIGINVIQISGIGPIPADKVAYLVEKKYPAEKLVDVMKQAAQARAKGQQVLVVRMNKNKKFQKEQLMNEGYEEFVEFFHN